MVDRRKSEMTGLDCGFDGLPRDVQLRIVKHMDIDTRLRLGIPPCRLRVPDEVARCLASVPRPLHYLQEPLTTVLLGPVAKYRLFWSRGRRVVHHREHLFMAVYDGFTGRLLDKVSLQN